MFNTALWNTTIAICCLTHGIFRNSFFIIVWVSALLLITPEAAFIEGLNQDVNSLDLPLVNVDQVIEDKTSIKVDIPKGKATSGYGLAFLYIGVALLFLIRQNY